MTIIYAEVSVRCGCIEGLDEARPSVAFQRVLPPWEATLPTGKSFLAYRKRGGRKRSLLWGLLYWSARCSRREVSTHKRRLAFRQAFPLFDYSLPP